MRDMILIGRGRSAEVFAAGDGRVVKLFYPGWGEEVARYEAGILEAVDSIGLPAPKYFGYKTIDGRPGLVFERIGGRSLLALIFADLLRIRHYGKLIARTQQRLHSFKGTGLPGEKLRFLAQIERSRGKLGSHYEGLVRELAAVSSENFTCHGDLHPDNMLVDGARIAVIDWMNAYSGTRAGDAARTYLMIVTPFMAEGTPVYLKPVYYLAKRVLAASYLNEYLRLSGIGRDAVMGWMRLVAAVRLCDEVPGEEGWLISMIERGPDKSSSPVLSAREGPRKGIRVPRVFRRLSSR